MALIGRGGGGARGQTGKMGVITNAALIAAAAYGLVVLTAYLVQRRLMYLPDPTRVPPASVGLVGVEEQMLATPDGEHLVVWRAAAKPGMPTILYFHGNAGGLASRAERISAFQGEGWGVAMMAYRGYSGSTGTPTEANNVADAKTAYDWLVKSGVDPDRIVVYGESLGSGVAVQLAVARKVRALILDSPYTSTSDVAVLSYPFLPVRLLLQDRYESSRYIAQLTAPLLVMHGELDRVIPVRMGRALFAKARGPKRLVIFPDGGHSNLFENGAMAAIRAWLKEQSVVPGR